jgi:hypothetical protein
MNNGPRIVSRCVEPKSNMLVLTILPPNQEEFIYNTSKKFVLEPGSVLVVIGYVEHV